MAGEFIPQGATCEADDRRGSDFGKCGNPARVIIHEKGRDYYACFDCWRHWTPHKPATK